MKVAVLGGGLTGLTAAYELAKKGHAVTIFEKEKFLGGMAAGFKIKGWEWSLEKTYHHLFANDSDFLNFAKELGFNKIFFKSPETASLYENSKFEIRNSKFLIYPLDTPLNLLRFSQLTFFKRLRTGLVVVFLKLSPFFSFYERSTCEAFLKKTMGDKAWNILWRELFRKKFGKYEENILASFFWARIKKRTKKLGYIEGGFQTFIDFLEKKNKKLGVVVKKGCPVERIGKRKRVFQIESLKSYPDKFEVVISTIPTPVLIRIVDKVFSSDYLNQLSKIKYLYAINLILETKKPLFKKTYWLNNAVSKIPIMGFFQHTNFIDKSHYNDNHILYIGWCVDENDKLLKMKKEEVLDFVKPYLIKISNIKYQISNIYLFKTPFAQPIFDKEFLKNKPEFKTPVKNFYIANLDMTYPYDRGSNYAVKLGKQVANLILNSLLIPNKFPQKLFFVLIPHLYQKNEIEKHRLLE
jgi:protoporphyrinogen oxidase